MCNEIQFRDKKLIPIAKKIFFRKRLNAEDGLTLLETRDIPALSRLADEYNYSKNGDFVYFVLNRQVNPTNICVLRCSFCDFASKKNRPDAYELTIEDILAKCEDGIQEIHITGGLHPDWKFSYYLEMLRAIKRKNPIVQIKAFTAVEIDFFAKREKLSIPEVLSALKEAGLDAMPGGGAEVFSERVRKLLYPFKIGAPRWLEIHKIAHEMNIPSNATILFGHIETNKERIQHLLLLRQLQDESPGFLSFIPLAIQPGKGNVVHRETSPLDSLKMIATSRLILDNFPHIKSYWVMLGEDTASVALNFGASDIDGTIGEERIAHASKANSPIGLTRDRILWLIRKTNKIPVERNALYQTIRIYN